MLTASRGLRSLRPLVPRSLSRHAYSPSRHSTIGTVLVLALSIAIGFAREAASEQLAIKTYNTDTGLAHNRVKRIVQDSHGFLWFCRRAQPAALSGQFDVVSAPGRGTILTCTIPLKDHIDAAQAARSYMFMR